LLCGCADPNNPFAAGAEPKGPEEAGWLPKRPRGVTLSAAGAAPPSLDPKGELDFAGALPKSPRGVVLSAAGAKGLLREVGLDAGAAALVSASAPSFGFPAAALSAALSPNGLVVVALVASEPPNGPCSPFVGSLPSAA
jgi:hypothetical protein